LFGYVRGVIGLAVTRALPPHRHRRQLLGFAAILPASIVAALASHAYPGRCGTRPCPIADDAAFVSARQACDRVLTGRCF
jgi:hypothetical protein